MLRVAICWKLFHCAPLRRAPWAPCGSMSAGSMSAGSHGLYGAIGGSGVVKTGAPGVKRVGRGGRSSGSGNGGMPGSGKGGSGVGVRETKTSTSCLGCRSGSASGEGEHGRSGGGGRWSGRGNGMGGGGSPRFGYRAFITRYWYSPMQRHSRTARRICTSCSRRLGALLLRSISCDDIDLAPEC